MRAAGWVAQAYGRYGWWRWRRDCGLGWHGLAVADDGDVVDDDGGEGFVAGVAFDAGDGGDESDGVGVALAEDGVVAVELGDGVLGDEELGAVGVGAGVGHGEAAGDGEGEGGEISSGK